MSSNISLKRAYETPSKEDGYRVLVDRLWPRGISKEDARLDDWLKDIAPSDDLRNWFHTDPDRWSDFRKEYLGELKAHRETARKLAGIANERHVTLIFGAKDEKHNNAVVLQQYLKMLN